MLPEAGTPNEFKQAWFEAAATPILGEVYAWVDGGKFRECWKIVGFSKPELRRVSIDVYSQGHSGRLERSVCGSNVYLPDWEKCILTGAVRYVGMAVPSQVILW
jgi:hypothetical protein